MIERAMRDFREIVETQETLSDVFEFRDLVNLSPEELEELRARIASTNGAIEMWIHSHYVGDFDPSTEEEIEMFTRYAEDRDRALKQISKGKIPVVSLIEANPFVPEMEENITDYEIFYRDLQEKIGGKVYFVRTFQGSAVPCLKHQEDLVIQKEDTVLDNWNELGSLMASLGVKTIIIRGRNLTYEDKRIASLDSAHELYLQNHPEIVDGNNTEVANFPSRCVGDAIVNLEVRGFTVKQSRITYPEQKYN